MASEMKVVLSKFPLRLMSSVRKTAEVYSAKEGVSLNQFINVAVAEKLAHLRHEDWIKNSRQPSERDIKDALSLLDSPGGQPPEPDDVIPEEYLAARRLAKARKLKRA